MRQLILLRLAHAEQASTGQADFDRPLAKRGSHAAPEIGRFLREASLIPDLAICSTAKRTRETLPTVDIGVAWRRLTRHSEAASLFMETVHQHRR